MRAHTALIGRPHASVRQINVVQMISKSIKRSAFFTAERELLQYKTNLLYQKLFNLEMLQKTTIVANLYISGKYTMNVIIANRENREVNDFKQ